MSLLGSCESLDDFGEAVAAVPLLREDEDRIEMMASSTLGIWFVQRWARGKMSALECLDGASRAADNEDDHLLTKLKKLGHSNPHRDLARLLKREYGGRFPPTYECEIPIWDDTLDRSVNEKLPFLLPHETLGMMSGEEVESWCANTSDVDELLGEWKQRVHFAESDQPLAPVSIWGDTAPFHTGYDSILLLLFGSLSVTGRHWITCVPKSMLCRCGCNGTHSMNAIWSIVAWSFACLVAGVYPLKDHNGEDFRSAWRRSRAGMRMPLRAAVLAFRGDWPWLSQVFHMRTHSGTELCFLCKASRSLNNPFTDVSSQATWRQTLLTHLGFVQEQIRSGFPVSPIFSIPGFQFEGITLDWMHMADLGITQVAIGNVMYEMFLALGGTITHWQEAVSQLTTYSKASAHDLGVDWPFTRMRLDKFRGKDRKPRLRAKAANTRACLPIVLHCLQQFFPAATPAEKMREDCLSLLNQAYLELYSWGAGSAVRLEDRIRRHLVLFLEIARPHAQKAEWTQWRWMPKHHMVLHLAEASAKFGNPRSFWNYLDEHEIGVAARVSESVHPKTLPYAALEKYQIWKVFKD